MNEFRELIVFANGNTFGFANHLRMADLEKLYDVEFCATADEVLGVFADVDRRPSVLVTSAMLPYEQGFTSAETRDGAETGLVLMRRLRRDRPQLPMIVYTFSDKLIKRLAEHRDPLLMVFDDGELTSIELLQALEGLLKKSAAST